MDDYPIIKSHLDKYHNDLIKRTDKGDTFYNLRSCAYMDDFFKPKIVYPEITKYLNFYYDQEAFFVNNKCFILTGEHIFFLTAFLNSSLFKFCFRNNFPELLGGTRELRKIFFDKIPIKKISQEIDDSFKKILLEIQHKDTSKHKSLLLEKEMDNLIFDIYSLTDNEKNIIGFIEIQ